MLKPELKPGCFSSSQEAPSQLSLVPRAVPPPGAPHTFLPQFPHEVRFPALTFLAAGRLREQPQEDEEQAAGRHGGRQGLELSEEAAERGRSCTWARRPPTAVSAWSIIKRINEGGRCSHLGIQIPLRGEGVEGGASVLLP